VSRSGVYDRMLPQGKCLSAMNHIQEQEVATTLKRYTRYERARIVGARALQISLGAPVLIRPDEGDPIDIAVRELESDAIPITVQRDTYK